MKRTPRLRDILDFYDAWLRSDSLQVVAAALSWSMETVCKRIRTHPEFQLAKQLAEQRRGDRQSFSGYIYKHLSLEAHQIWDKIRFWDDSANYDRIEAILGGQTLRVRQELFIHALVTSGFDTSEALRMTAISRWTLNHWSKDLDFRQLIEEIQWHKKNFFERSLIDLVEQRHPAAVLFVNRTVNKDRGYGESIQLETKDSGFSIEDLDLDIETRKKVLEAIRIKQGVKDIEATVEPVKQLSP